MTLVKGKHYAIEWVDIQSDSAWRSIDELREAQPAITKGNYIYLGKGKSGYIFAGEQNGSDYGNSTIIPLLGLIKNIKKIK